MPTRREFLKLMGAISLALGLRLPVIEPELEFVQEYDAPSYEVWIDDEAWWIHGSDGTTWKSDDMGETWQQRKFHATTD